MSADDEARREAAGNAVLIYCTFPDAAAAETVAEALVSTGLVACANIIPGMTSIFIWEGRLEREQEVVMILKTRFALADEVVAETRRHHPYDNPAIVVLPLAGGSRTFLDWIVGQTRDAEPA